MKLTREKRSLLARWIMAFFERDDGAPEVRFAADGAPLPGGRRLPEIGSLACISTQEIGQ